MAKKTETRPATGHINPFGLRMQPDLRARLEEAALEAGRSLNAEITDRLEASFRRSYDDSDLVEATDKLKERVDIMTEDAEIAKAGAFTSSLMTAELIDTLFRGRAMPETLRRLQEASRNVAKAYEEALKRSKSDVARRALETPAGKSYRKSKSAKDEESSSAPEPDPI